MIHVMEEVKDFQGSGQEKCKINYNRPEDPNTF